MNKGKYFKEIVLSAFLEAGWITLELPARFSRIERNSSCVRGGLDWISGKMSLLKEWSGIRTGCPGKGWSHHPWRCSKNV